jgi:hypothetical protein
MDPQGEDGLQAALDEKRQVVGAWFSTSQYGTDADRGDHSRTDADTAQENR